MGEWTKGENWENMVPSGSKLMVKINQFSLLARDVSKIRELKARLGIIIDIVSLLLLVLSLVKFLLLISYYYH